MVTRIGIYGKMPLLGGKLHVSNPIWKQKKLREDSEQNCKYSERPSFMVSETSEICSSEEELRRKNTIYAGNIWTCRVTGRSNLTYKQASSSEASANRVLRKNFPKCFEKPVLERVHLSTQPLDMLVHSCWTLLHEQFHVTEPVKLKVDSVSSTPIHGIICNIDTSQGEKETLIAANNNATTSPNSSDKENTASKKCTPVKRKYVYTVKVLSDVPLVVNDVPACSITRVNRTPTKEHVRMFIRAHAMRYGPNFSGPWIVDSDMLRRHKIFTKNQEIEVDRVKLKQMSRAMEEEYEARLLNQRQNSGTSDDFISPAPIFKKTKRFSVLREGNNETTEDDLPLTAFKGQSKTVRKSHPQDSLIKKMKQATLFQFRKNSSEDSLPTAPRTSKQFCGSSLPRIAQHLVKMFNENRDNPAIMAQVTLCAKVLSDTDLVKLPNELRDKVLLRRDAIQYRKKLMAMSPQQRKALVRERREKLRAERLIASRLVDDLQLIQTLDVHETLPEPTALSLPTEITECLFGRLLGLCEFFHCFQNLLLEGVEYGEPENQCENMTPNHTYPLSALDSCVPLPGEVGYSDDEDQLETDAEEEEAALIVATAPLPEASIRALRRLGLRRLIKAVSMASPSAGAYRSLTRPLTLLMRLLLRDEDLGKKRELGIRLTKLPVTPYTAPELFRLVLLHDRLEIESSNSVDSSNTESGYMRASDTAELINHLSTMDVYQSCPEVRLKVLETAVERLFDMDLIDDHILACQRRASEAWNKKMKLLRDHNMRKKEQKDIACQAKKENVDASVTVDVKHESESESTAVDQGTAVIYDDLASIVKRRRLLAARAAAEREERENLERERRAVQAKEYAQERALSTVSRAHEMRSAEARCALRCHPIGYDRYYRRIWYFRCAPDCLFVESNWAASDIHCATGNSAKAYHTLNEETQSPVPSSAHISNTVEGETMHHAWSSWSVYDQPEQLEQLASALLDRGIREGNLKRHLSTNGLLDAIKMKWKKSLPNRSIIGAVKNNLNTTAPHHFSARDQSGNQQPATQYRIGAEAALAGALLKNLLDTEVRLRSGGLGGVPDFTKWQEQLAKVNSSFGLPHDSLPKTPSVASTDPNILRTPDRQGLIDALIEVAEHIIPRFLNVPNLVVTRKERSENTNSQLLEQSECAPESKRRYLEEESSTSDSSTTSADPVWKDPDSHANRTHTWLMRWRNEVLNAHTLSRLNLLHACLDASIRWEKSVEDARCRICRHKSDDDNLLLCDGCNRAFHLYCLRPPLRRVPVDDWFCPSCQPTSKESERRRREARLARSKRRRTTDGSSSEDEEHNGASECNRAGQGSDEDVESVNRTVRPNVDRRSKSDLQSPKISYYNTTSSGIRKRAFRHDPSCLLCGCNSGDLVHCFHCPNTFHLSCHNPPLRHPPRGDRWICASCRHTGRLNAYTRQRSTRESRRITYQHHCQQEYNTYESEEDHNRSSSRLTRSMSQRSKSAHSSSDPESASAGVTGDESLDTTNDHESWVLSRKNRPCGTVHPATALNAKRRRRQSSADQRISGEGTPLQHQSDCAQQICSKLINAIIKHRHSWPFREPVDKEEVPDYYEIITNPVDLSMIRSWLSQGRYNSSTIDAGLSKLVQDLGLMFYNAELYNAADSDVWIAGSNLEQYVRTQIAHLKTDVCYRRQALGDL